MRRFLRRTALRGFLVVWVCLALACPRYSATVPVGVDPKKPIQTVLIHKHHFLLRGNEALIITDQTEIQELMSLLSHNKRNQHACGFHWVFRFQHSLVDASFLRHNQDCQTYRHHNWKIQRLFDSYFRRITEQPSSFLYHLRIDASYEPDVVASHLTHDDVSVFCFWPESRLPHVQLHGSFTVDLKREGDDEDLFETRSTLVDARIQEIARLLNTQYRVQKIKGPTYMGGPEYRHDNKDGPGLIVFKCFVYFEYGQQLQGVDALLTDVEIVETVIPVTYTIQLATPVPLNAEQITQFQETYEFIRAIEPFNSG